MSDNRTDAFSRREFMQTAAAASAAFVVPSGLHAAGSDVIRVGLVGCGGRGTGAATQAMAADPNARLVAMADAFEDRLHESLSLLRGEEKVGSQIDVRSDHAFVGFDAYQKLLSCGVDVVLL